MTTYTVKSAIEALQTGSTITEMAAKAGWPVVEGCLVPEPALWHANDGNAEVVEEHASGEDAALAYVDGGEWDSDDETCWITVRVWRDGIDEDGEKVRVEQDQHTIAVHPEEPECLEGQGHDWQEPMEIVGGCKESPGVHGHGGGVTINSVCMRCGCSRITDTWAQDPNTGRQGLTSVSYEPEKYASKVAAKDTATPCACGGWCECHKPGWPEGETCDCARLMTPTAHPLPQGARVRFFDGCGYRYGSVVTYTKAAYFEWKVYVVRTTNGIGNSCSGPNGEVFSVVEVHPDRIREVIDPDEVSEEATKDQRHAQME